MDLRPDQTKALQSHIGTRPDGIWGPLSSARFDAYFGTGADDISTWPRESEMVEFYGPHGTGQTRGFVPDKYPMVLSWDTAVRVTSFSCHVRCKTAFEELLHRLLDHYGTDGIVELNLHLFGGIFNDRKKRGGDEWSTHAYGCAVDLHPAGNQFRWDHTQAAFARPEYDPLHDIAESIGFVSLGKSRDYDWMHFQLATLG